MKRSIFAKRVKVLRQSLPGGPKTECDTAWIVRPENRRYLSGFKAEDFQLTESSGSLLINKARTILVTDSRYTLEAENEAVGFEVKTLKQGLIEGFPELVSGIGTRNLGFEQDYMTWGFHRELSEKFREIAPHVRLIPLERVVEKMREVKDPMEVDALEASADLMSAVLDEIVSGLKPGLTEKEVAWRIEGLVREAGAEGLAFPSIVASGPNSALPHAVPTDRKLESGEPVILDVGARLNGYCSDMTRTVFLGEPGPYFRKIYMTVRQAQLSAPKEIRPGLESDKPDAVARQLIGNEGFGDYFGHGLGHGVGLATHESPRLSPLKPMELKRGMVVTVEPGIYVPGRGGVRLEETVVIEDNGPRILTKAGNFYDFAS